MEVLFIVHGCTEKLMRLERHLNILLFALRQGSDISKLLSELFMMYNPLNWSAKG